MFKTIYFFYFLRLRSKRLDSRYKRLIEKLANLVLPVYFLIFCKNNKLYAKPKNNLRLIVSLTTFPARVEKVWLPIETILAQNIKPDAIFLWLYKGEFPDKNKLPKSLLRLEKRGVTIRFCNENLMPHKKYYYTMREHPDATIITIDDDVYYPPNLIEKLIRENRRSPNVIICTRTRKIQLGYNGKPSTYKKWLSSKNNTPPSHENIAIGVGAPLYPPGALDKEVFNKPQLKKLALRADDLWLKIMAIRNNTKVLSLGGEYSRIYINVKQKNRQSLEQENKLGGKNDQIFNNLLDHYKIDLNKIAKK